MSSILKALRKLEEEKRGGKLEAPDLRVDQGRPASVGKSFLPLVAGIVFGAVIVGLFFLWPPGPTQKPDVVQSEPLAPVVSAALQAVVNEAPPVPETAKALPDTSAPAKSETPVAASVNEPAVTQAMRAPDPATVTGSEPRRQKASPLAPGIAGPAEPARAVVEKSVPGEVVALPEGISLIVTEIFYQDAVNSMAVVNDLPVMVGGHIDSAMVTAIHIDRVLFEIDGKVYTVSASQP